MNEEIDPSNETGPVTPPLSRTPTSPSPVPDSGEPWRLDPSSATDSTSPSDFGEWVSPEDRPSGRASAWGATEPDPSFAAASSPGRRSLRPVAAALVVAAAIGTGIGIGAAIWSSTSPSPRPIAGLPNGFFGGGSSNPFGRFGAGSPFNGSGGPGVFGGGALPSSGSTNNGGPSNISAIAAKVDPTLVDITVTLNGGQTASGTGIVLTSHGVVLTNNHVVEGATSISVTDVGNGQTYSATVLGYDRTRDIAVIKLVHASGLRTAKIGSSTSLAVGTRVVAIGNAGGAGGTPSVAGGTITALHRAITASDALSGQSENLSGLIEINANVQPGDSGGSLVNGSGHVIGVDTAASQSFSLSSQSSQGYAIPITTALQIVHQIEARRSSSTIHVGPTAYLGVLVTTAGPSAVNPYGQPGGGTTVQGAAIRAALGGGPASVAGLAPGDVITSVDAHRVTTAAGLSVLMETFTPGEHVRVGWTDPSGVTHTTSITLGTGPAQ